MVQGQRVFPSLTRPGLGNRGFQSRALPSLQTGVSKREGASTRRPTGTILCMRGPGVNTRSGALLLEAAAPAPPVVPPAG